MVTDNSGRAVVTDDEGYLVEPESWDAEVARNLSRGEQLELNDEHWQVLGFMRNFYHEHQIIPDARFVIKFIADELGYGSRARNYLFTLFPYGYVKQACKIAGMRRPRAWSTG